ncbi:type IV toxin-antitoxin system AbiEi family antitoxin domain-containing protein [Mycobacterium sp. AZCC_0083]|uniref:type IV toxin-antitoxin system AbiEi family antitoxin domain-containing protein n=1 Tax=Mycobacterium sp. AZCC_0083 TaxID=2735882 RepID=UPI001611D00B|nr:type IV toxin-antitoxin system AbiEi family antitoxin domain-containing protein [Mycobacterium sp. AZCC_0083]MBB5162159.1 very-short-patch-repair endonuclease [Mycobacterium sp. AZCC_0083]
MLNELLRQHDGVLTLAQAQDIGLSRQAIHRRVSAGHWQRCAPGVYFVNDRPFDDAARIRAAVWSYGDSAAASGLAAAWWLRLTRFAPPIVEVTVPRNSNGRSHAGSQVRRRDLAPTDIEVQRGMRVTALPLTVIEAAVRMRGGAKLMDTALQRHVELRPLWNAHLRNKGRYGAPAARRLLQAADDGARSEAERLLIRLLKAAGITGWKANYPVAGYKVDVGFQGCTVAIEVDGLAFHSDSDDFHNDRVRQNAIALAGWQVLRFTWLDLTEYPDRVVAEIRRATSA